MKGVVFTERPGMVKQQFSAAVVDEVLDDAALLHGGAYTAVGTYPFSEMLTLLGALSARSGLAAPQRLRAFGACLFGRFYPLYLHFITACDRSMALLAQIEQVIHTEVCKRYPDAKLPAFLRETFGAPRLSLACRAPRCLATGLVEGAMPHDGEQARLTLRRDALDAQGSCVRFILEPL